MTIFSRLHRHLDPGDSLAEAIFGLIMVLTFTLGAGLLEADGPIDGRDILIAAIGCNLAWGIIDAILYLLGSFYERRRVAALIEELGAGDSAVNGMAKIREELDSELANLADPGIREKLYASIAEAARKAKTDAAGLTAEDFKGAVTVFLIVLGSAAPAALPFLLIADGYLALRTSNLLLVGSLFLVGYRWGAHIGAKPLQSGAMLLGIGVVLVLVAIALGG